MTRTTAANFVQVDTTEETAPTGLTFTFADTSRFPAVPFYTALARTDDTRREVVKFSTKTATTLQCASLADRYLAGSVAESGITHPAGTPVLSAPLAQNLSDLWDAIEAHDAAAGAAAHAGLAIVSAAAPAAPATNQLWYDTTNELLKRWDGDSWEADGNAAYLPKSAARAYKSAAAQSIADATFTTVTFDAESFDDDTFHDNSTNNSRLTVPTSRRYRVHAQIAFAANATGFRYARITKNGTTVAETYVAAGGGDINTVTVSTLEDATAADYFEIQVYQASGGALNVVQSEARTFFEIEAR